MVRAILPARSAMPLAARKGEQKVMARHGGPVSLVQVLARMQRARVVVCMHLHRFWPVVRRPRNVTACHQRTGAEPAGTCEQVDSVDQAGLIRHCWVLSGTGCR